MRLTSNNPQLQPNGTGKQTGERRSAPLPLTCCLLKCGGTKRETVCSKCAGSALINRRPVLSIGARGAHKLECAHKLELQSAASGRPAADHDGRAAEKAEVRAIVWALRAAELSLRLGLALAQLP